MNGSGWSPREDALFAQLFAQGLKPADMVDRFPNRTPKAIRSKWERADRARRKGQGSTPEPTSPETRDIEVSGDRATVTVSGLREEIQDLDDLVRVCRIDLDRWTIEGYRQKAYQGFIKNAADQIETVQLFSVSATLKAKKLQALVRDELNALIEEARRAMPPAPTVARAHRPLTGYMASVNITDLHMGKYAWWKECGSNYDVEIAEYLLLDAVEDLVQKLKPWPVDLFVLTIGSDLLNADNSENTTTGGTPQTTDGRQQRTFRRTWQLMRRVILRFREIAPVHCVVVNGNHDRDASFAIGEVLGVAFEGFPDVTLDNGPARRKYVEWGACLVGYTHGDEIRTKDIPTVMAEECAEAWGRTCWRCMETGHLHQQLVTEFPGVLVRVNPALCGPEDWHAAKGFVGKIRALHAQLWHKKDGNVAQLSSVPVAPNRAQIHKAA